MAHMLAVEAALAGALGRAGRVPAANGRRGRRRDPGRGGRAGRAAFGQCPGRRAGPPPWWRGCARWPATRPRPSMPARPSQDVLDTRAGPDAARGDGPRPAAARGAATRAGHGGRAAGRPRADGSDADAGGAADPGRGPARRLVAPARRPRRHARGAAPAGRGGCRSSVRWERAPGLAPGSGTTWPGRSGSCPRMPAGTPPAIRSWLGRTRCRG